MILLLLIIALLIILLVVLLVKKQESNEKIESISNELSQLKASNLILETNQLKFQLQPHTLNNILANLKAFANKLHRGIESLSSTLDYIYNNSENQYVSIDKELEFIKNYRVINDLTNSNMGSFQVITTDLDINSVFYNQACIPHLISAYFLENAFKHGDTKHPDFLKVSIVLNDNRFELHVVNKIKKDFQATKSGIGLKNMNRRLSILHEGKYSIKNSCNEQEYYSSIIIYF